MDKLSYALGMSMAQNLLELQLGQLVKEDFFEGFKAQYDGKDIELSIEEAGRVINEALKKIEAEKNATKAEIAKVMEEQGKKFLAENKDKEGVVTLESGLQYREIVAGDGKKPKGDSKVKCHYEGRFIDGMVFDSSYKRNEPAIFGVNQVIKGWTEALQLMREGSKWELFIPYELAYGEYGAGEAIPPCACLLFTVELLEVL